MNPSLSSIRILLLFTLLFSLSAWSQETKPTMDTSKITGGATKSSLQTTDCKGEKSSPSADLKWRPIVTHKRIAREPEVPNKETLDKMKAEKLLLKYSDSVPMEHSYTSDLSDQKNFNSVTPVVGSNYLGNTNNNSSPMDNSVAISDGGWIVSVANTTIEYDAMDGTNSYFNDIASFIDDPDISDVCDPVVIYDAGADRFIFFAQECSGDYTNSYLLIFFSKTNNPNDGWWYYKFTGNPLNDNSSFDYPKLAVSNEELFIAGNLFNTDGLFNEAIVYQFDKSAAYNGESVSWLYWHNIDGSPFTICPVSYGHGTNYGPGIYMVSTSSGGGSTIHLFDLTQSIGNSPSLNQYTIATDTYSPAANANQLDTSTLLDNGDCRTLSGFYLDGTIHFVFHSDIGNGWNGVNYNRLDVSGQTNVSGTYGLSGTFDYSYPSVVSFGNDVTDRSVMIGFGRTGPSIYPQVRVVNCDEDWNWSNSTLVKAGSSYVSYTSTETERWGDYTGTCRKHNSTSPSIWMNGMYGTNSHKWFTWVAEISGGANTGIDEIKNETPVSLYPNPVIDMFHMEFDLETTSTIAISILDDQGKTVQSLYTGIGHAGTNVFSFNQANLSPGTYFVTINTTNNTIAYEKIIITN